KNDAHPAHPADPVALPYEGTDKMRKYTLGTLLAAALLPVLLVITPAAAATTLTVYDHQSHFRFDSTTQTFSFNGTLHTDSRQGPVVGHAHVSCTFTSGHQAACTATATFDGQGQIFIAGSINTNKNHFFIPITGGN